MGICVAGQQICHQHAAQAVKTPSEIIMDANMTPEVNSRGLERHESAGVCAAARLVCVCVCVDI